MTASDNSDANFSELVSYAFDNTIESAEEFTEIVAEESNALGTLIIILFIVLMVVIVLVVIIAGTLKIIKG